MPILPNDCRLRDPFSTAEAVLDLAIVAEIDKSFQSLLQGVVVKVEHAVVDDQCIELIAWFEAAHLSKETACRLGGNPENFGQGKERLVVIILVVHLADLNGIYQHAEHVEVVPSTDVAAQ